jgi:hypothetical protein
MSIPDRNGANPFEANFLSSEFIHFEIQGRLGNQLFGLSDAHRLGRFFNRKVVLDVFSVTHEYGEPEWLDFVSEWEWAEVSKFVPIHSESQEYRRVNVGAIDGKTQKINSIFHGFNPSIKQIEESGLFFKGEFPFSQSGGGETNIENLALCFRRGDYHNNPHLGILPSHYYIKAIAELRVPSQSIKTTIFSDSKAETIKFLKENDIPFDRFDDEISALTALKLLSGYGFIVGANSTFSFWGTYFSKSKFTLPTPLYVAAPKWGTELFEGSIAIKYIRFSRARYYFRLLSNRLQLQISRKMDLIKSMLT